MSVRSAELPLGQLLTRDGAGVSKENVLPAVIALPVALRVPAAIST